jgi:hypothetical protein
MRAYSGRLASQLRHWAAVDEIVAGGHLGNDEPRAERGGQSPKGRVGHTRHWSQKDRVGDLDAAYFQLLRA